MTRPGPRGAVIVSNGFTTAYGWWLLARPPRQGRAPRRALTAWPPRDTRPHRATRPDGAPAPASTRAPTAYAAPKTPPRPPPPGRKPQDTPPAAAEAARRSARSVGKLFLVPQRDRRRGPRPQTHTVTTRVIHTCVKHSKNNGKEQLCPSAP